ncbi:MAG: hypothetical protein A2Y62_02770 [Candidatus Fischerbacteria bacterium RBG_13_37_8]|uniref:Cytochrome c domain-containing protein n=1 Tax=Candidatus Fischerbacteria bacterium RBG_13_37_8 TaxID=1817863 RepID=A0A1F5VXR5_9BACT|nr:MAG: hypothetical protein A2Y62_02770 [Candidatus Fischerbacteria bacterium RBG_13_37_8]
MNFQSKGEGIMKKVLLSLLLVSIIFLLFADRGNAIPAFARKHSFNCNMCHTAYPKLNDFGQRFRDNGYQIPGQVGGEKSIFATSPPIAIRALPGYDIYKTECCKMNSFHIFGVDILAAGVFHENLSFLFIYTPRIDEPAADYTGPQDGLNPRQLASVESANVVFSNVIDNKLNFRVGRFEPSYLPFSAKRSYYLFSPYEIYDFATPMNTFIVGDNQLGIEAAGHFKSGFKYAVGFMNGNNGNPDNNNNKDIYFRLLKTFGRGDGQSAGQRIGIFGIYGMQPTSFYGSIVSPFGETDGFINKQFYRIGLDASINWSTLNFQFLYMIGKDDKALNTLRPTEDYEYSGGFAQIDWAVMKNNRLVLSLLYNWVFPPDYDEQGKLKTYSVLGRYYLGNWEAVNVALHLEYTYKGRTICRFREDIIGMVIDFAF